MAKSEARPLETVAPPRNFTLTVDDRVRAYTQGVPGYIRRRRRIEELEARLVATLRAAEDRAQALGSKAVAADLATLNDLIGRHNRYYPIEANLPIEVRTGRLLDRGVPWRPLPPVTAEDLLARAAEMA
ncbi:MAG TPA: hypothetical protein VN962_14515 [Polyangia bacterium]|nr:hypothetical protein [Polyangia bacterium]